MGVIPIKTLQQPSVPRPEVMVVEERVGWTRPILNYLTEGKFPDDKLKARRIKYQSLRYVLYDGQLYR